MVLQLTSDNIAIASRKATDFLRENHVDDKEVIRQEFSLEEVLTRYMAEFGSDAMFDLELGKRLGQLKIRITVKGPMMDPLAAAESPTLADSFMQNAMLRLGQLPAWQYRRGANVVLFTVSRKKIPEWGRLLVTIAAAILCGLLARLMPDGTRTMLQQSVVAPLLDTFLGFLNAIAGPMIFLSVVLGIYGIGDAATFSVLGKKVGGWFMSVLAGMTLLAALCSLPFFSLNMGQAQEEGSAFLTMYRMVLGIVPTNLFTPFSRGNTLQILLIAVMMGIAMLRISDRAQQIAGLAEQLSAVVRSIMEFIGRLVLFFVFGNIFNLIVGSDLNSLSRVTKLVLAIIAACVFMAVLHTAGVALLARVSPGTLWRRSISTFLIGLTTASSSAAFKDNLEVCTKKHHILPELTGFAVPFGQILYKPMTAVIYWLAAICLAEQNATPVSAGWLLTVFVLCLILSVATPPVAGGATASYSILFAQLGFLKESLAVVLTLDIVLDFLLTAVTLFAGQCVLLVAAGRMGMVSGQDKTGTAKKKTLPG